MMTERILEFDVVTAQHLRAQIMDRLSRNLIGHQYLDGWVVDRYPDSMRFTSRDKKRVLKVTSDLTFSIDAIHSKTEVKSHTFQCKTFSEAWNYLNATVKAYKQ